MSSIFERVQHLFQTVLPNVAHLTVRNAVCVEGELALAAIESNDISADCHLSDQYPELVHAIGRELEVEDVGLVKWDANVVEFIRNAFVPVSVKSVEIEFDQDVQENVAKVLVADKDLEAALGANGNRVRLAAMLTDHNIEVVLETENDQPGLATPSTDADSIPQYPSPDSWEYANDRQAQRAARSFEALRQRAVPVYSGPLFVADDDEVMVQPASEVARRVLVLWAVELRAE